ncbi:MAG: glucose-6-phosphate isomerase [Bauldia sp.]|nr:glucose-6-phosphate isomerase [Bauldia sp.]
MTALTDALPSLSAHRNRLAAIPMRQMFADDPERFATFSATAGSLFLDYSKTRIDRAALEALVNVADAGGVEAGRDAMFAGREINATERRAVLHKALRAAPGDHFETAGRDILPEVFQTRERMLAFAERVRSGDVAGVGGPFTDIVNIGIGGSDLGPAMSAIALRPYLDGPRLHFVSNVDGADITDTLAGLDASRTLFLVASKTFTTLETMTNAATARRWVVERLGEGAVGRHFAAMSTALGAVARFGISEDRTFGFWDWVGGRYSLWSSIGLPVAIGIGAARFNEFLAGARLIDRHFQDAPLARNLPVLMALIGVWHRDVWAFPALAVLPYEQRLRRFAAYLQQLDMESNGKRVRLSGELISEPTGPIVFGEPGTNGQHAFYQLLHQGTEIVPCEFLVGASDHEGLDEHHTQLVANCLAQSEALMRGKNRHEVETELRATGMDPDAIASLAPHKVFPGDRPSITIVYPKLTPSVLGQLIALYEHRVFVQGLLWGLNSFDQWGVELGKQLAAGLVGAVRSGRPPDDRDGSTAGLVGVIARMREGG